jgi:hypothetical protein
MDTIRLAMRWVGPLDRGFVAHVTGLDRSRSWSASALHDPVQWAMGVLGLTDPASALAVPDRSAVQRRFRDLLREAHPDHGGDIDDAAQRIADLSEARRILLVS